MSKNKQIRKAVFDLIISKKLTDLKPEDEQCKKCIDVATQIVSTSGGNIEHCDFHGPHIGTQYGETHPKLVLVGLENPEPNETGEFEQPLYLEKPSIKYMGSLHRKGEFALISKVFSKTKILFAHVATLNRRLHGLRSKRKSASHRLPACPYAAEILHLLKPDVIVIEERKGWLPAGYGWGSWLPRMELSEMLGKSHKKRYTATIMTTELDDSKVALVRANHPSTRSTPWIASSGKNYMGNILVPAVREAIQLAIG